MREGLGTLGFHQCSLSAASHQTEISCHWPFLPANYSVSEATNYIFVLKPAEIYCNGSQEKVPEDTDLQQMHVQQ